MNVRELVISKRNKVLPLRTSLWVYGIVHRRGELNQYCDIPYWLAILPALTVIAFLFLLHVIQYGAVFPLTTFKVIGSASVILLLQLLASEAVNRKVIRTFTTDIIPIVDDKTVWSKLDAPLRDQLLYPVLGMAVGVPMIIQYADALFPSMPIDMCFVFGLGIVLFNTMYGMFMHIFSSMSLVSMTSYFSNRLYEFFPTGSPVIRHLVNLYSTALLITILTSIATVTVVVLSFPSPIMFKFAAISLIAAIGTAVFAFLHHLHSVHNLIDNGKEKAIGRIQRRIDEINKVTGTDPGANKNALEEIGKLLDISEKIQNAKPRILTVNITMKYVISIVSPVLPLLGQKDYMDAISALLEGVGKDL